MKRKIYSIFSNVDDAKQALGSIKKASLNLADLTVVFADNKDVHPETHATKRRDNYEFAMELNFPRETNFPQDTIWPGLQKGDLTGVGKIQIGLSSKADTTDPMEPSQWVRLADRDWEIIKGQVKENKVVAIVETEAELAPKLRLILESNGGEILAVPESY